VPYSLDHQRCAIAVLNARRMDDDAERKAFGINECMDLSPLDRLKARAGWRETDRHKITGANGEPLSGT
jgi:hypothetical protein